MLRYQICKPLVILLHGVISLPDAMSCDKFKSETALFIYVIYRGSYMSAHVLLNLLNELGKRDKMRGLLRISSLFRNEFKFNNTKA